MDNRYKINVHIVLNANENQGEFVLMCQIFHGHEMLSTGHASNKNVALAEATAIDTAIKNYEEVNKRLGGDTSLPNISKMDEPPF